MPSSAPNSKHPLLRPPVIGWGLYDFANTIFSFAVITSYYNEWMLIQRNVDDWKVALGGLVVSVLLVLTLIPIGAIADAYGRRMPFLIGFTALCCLATVALGLVSGVLAAIVCAGIAVYGFQSALSHYDPLLAEVAEPHEHGLVSGFGVGLGYLGALVGALSLLHIVGEGNKQHAFVPTALMVFIFAIPCFALVREKARPRHNSPSARTVIRDANSQLLATARKLPSQRTLARFMLARFLYVDAIVTVIANMTVFMARVGDFSQAEKTGILATAMISAAIGAFTAGWLVDRLGPKKVLLAVLMFFVPALTFVAAVGAPWTVYIAGPAVGISLGTVWTSDRVLMMRISPPDERGEYFSIYNLVGKLSSGVGPFVLWGGSVFLVHNVLDHSKLSGSRVALVMLAIATLCGAWILRKVEVPDADALEVAEAQLNPS